MLSGLSAHSAQVGVMLHLLKCVFSTHQDKERRFSWFYSVPENKGTAQFLGKHYIIVIAEVLLSAHLSVCLFVEEKTGNTNPMFTVHLNFHRIILLAHLLQRKLVGSVSFTHFGDMIKAYNKYSYVILIR